MTITIDQCAGAKASKKRKEGTTWSVPYKISIDAVGDPAVRNAEAYRAFANYIIGQKPTANGHYWESLEVSEISDAVGLYNAQVQYSPTGDKRENRRTPTLSFSTKGGTAHVTTSIATAEVAARAGFNAPDWKRLIGASFDKPATGCDIKTPYWTHNFTLDLPDSMVTTAFLSQLYNATGCINSDSAWFFNPHECLFAGVDGNSKDEENQETGDLERWWTFNFSFEGSPTVTRNIPGIGDITKRGYDYIWTLERITKSGTFTIKQPAAVYREQVYPTADFSLFTNLLN